jgi:hypothetical protein
MSQVAFSFYWTGKYSMRPLMVKSNDKFLEKEFRV